MDVGEFAAVRTRFFRIEDFGGSIQNASDYAMSDLKAKFENLINEQIMDNYCYQTQLSDFRFILFSGDAPTSEFKKIRQAVKETTPEFSDRFKEGIDPAWVAAIGSARYWKETKHRDSRKLFDFQRIETQEEFEAGKLRDAARQRGEL